MKPFAPVFAARGRTEWRSAGSAVFAAKYSITSSRRTINISGDWGVNTSPTTTKTERTSAWRRRRRQAGRLSHARANLASPLGVAKSFAHSALGVHCKFIKSPDAVHCSFSACGARVWALSGRVGTP
jgi:hypothetical protein